MSINILNNKQNISNILVKLITYAIAVSLFLLVFYCPMLLPSVPYYMALLTQFTYALATIISILATIALSNTIFPNRLTPLEHLLIYIIAIASSAICIVTNSPLLSIIIIASIIAST